MDAYRTPDPPADEPADRKRTYGEKIRWALAEVGVELFAELVVGLAVVLPLTLLLTWLLSLAGVAP